MQLDSPTTNNGFIMDNIRIDGGIQMNRPKYEYKQLKITELLLNPTNPRFDPVKHQTEVIVAMIDDQMDKLVALSKHIVRFGLNPTDIILIEPKDSYWIVKEGNRRITALKLVNEPNLIPARYGKIKRAFQRLNEDVDTALVESIPCVVINDEKISNEWIRLKHTGENKGIGTVNWDSQQTGRFGSQVSGKTDERIVFLDHLRIRNDIPLELKEQFSLIKKTNFDRLMGDPDVRNLVGVSNRNGSYVLNDGANEYLLAILYDLAFEDLSVGKIYHKDDRIEYINDIKERISKRTQTDGTPPSCDNVRTERTVEANDESSKANTAESNHTDTTSSDNTTSGNSRGKSYPVYRKALIPSKHKLTINYARILKIFNELKTLDTESYPNAVAALFRVFIELSVDCYISKHQLSSVNADSKLFSKIEAVANNLESKGIMSKHELRSARQMSSSQTQNNSVKTFHSYIHNKDVTPVSADIRTAWDDLWPFIDNIWR